MRPQDVTDVTFRRAPWYRIGVDAAEVRAYLGRIADALALRDHVERTLRSEIARLRSENEHIKVGLSRWQAEQRSHGWRAPAAGTAAGTGQQDRDLRPRPYGQGAGEVHGQGSGEVSPSLGRFVRSAVATTGHDAVSGRGPRHSAPVPRGYARVTLSRGT
ncbi:MAG TPA: DivIVA domain-containing protein [Rugosimonospora sp.]